MRRFFQWPRGNLYYLQLHVSQYINSMDKGGLSVDLRDFGNEYMHLHATIDRNVETVNLQLLNRAPANRSETALASFARG